RRDGAVRRRLCLRGLCRRRLCDGGGLLYLYVSHVYRFELGRAIRPAPVESCEAAPTVAQHSASYEVSPAVCSRYARMKPSRSPSRTPCALPTSNPVRASLT